MFIPNYCSDWDLAVLVDESDLPGGSGNYGATAMVDEVPVDVDMGPHDWLEKNSCTASTCLDISPPSLVICAARTLRDLMLSCINFMNSSDPTGGRAAVGAGPAPLALTYCPGCPLGGCSSCPDHGVGVMDVSVKLCCSGRSRPCVVSAVGSPPAVLALAPCGGCPRSLECGCNSGTSGCCSHC